MAYLCVKANNATKKYKIEASANKPYIKCAYGYVGFHNSTGTGLKIKNGNTTYKVVETKTTTQTRTSSRQTTQSSSQTVRVNYTSWGTAAITPIIQTSTVSFGRASLNSGWKANVGNSYQGLTSRYYVFNQRNWVGINGYNNSLQSYHNGSWGYSFGVNKHSQYSSVNYGAYIASLAVTILDAIYRVPNSTNGYYDVTYSSFESNIGACEYQSAKSTKLVSSSRNSDGSVDNFTYIITLPYSRTINKTISGTTSSSSRSIRSWSGSQRYTNTVTITVTY